MTELILWTNQEMNRLRRDMDRLFNQVLAGFGVEPFFIDTVPSPYIDIYEKGNSLYVRVELPGVDPKDIEISLTGKQLTITAKKEVQTIRRGVFYGEVEKGLVSFSKTIRLPYRIQEDQIKASLKKGILVIEMPITEEEQRKRVKVKVR